MDRPTLFAAQDLLEALLMPGFVDALNGARPDDFADFYGFRAEREAEQEAFIAAAAPQVQEALNGYLDRQLAAPMRVAVRGEDYDPHRLAAVFLDPATSEDELRVASLYGDNPGDEADADTIGTAPNLLAEYCYLLGSGDRAEALALLAVLVGDFDGWQQALAGEDLDTLQRDLKAQAESVRTRHLVTVRMPTGIWNEFREQATLDVETTIVTAEGPTVAEAIRTCQIGAPLLDFESAEPWSGPAPVRAPAAEPSRPRSFAPFGDPFSDPRIDYADELADPLASGFSIASAIRAHEGTSMVPERRGIASVASNVRFLRKVRDYFMRYAETEKQREVAAEEFERYRQGYVSHTNREQARRAQVRSAMITGPARFQTRRNEAKSSAYERAVEDSAAWSERAQKAAIRAIKEAGPYGDTSAPVSSDDPEAATKLKAKIEVERKQHEADLAANRLLKRELSDEETAEGLRRLGYSESQVQFHTKTRYYPDKGQEKGGRWLFATANRPANIRRLEKRLAQLARHRAEAGGELTVDVAGVGEVRIVDSVEDNRLRLYFPDKPSYELREKLKRNGFKWAPSEGAWQRMRGGNAEYAVYVVLGVSDLHKLLQASAQPEPDEEPEVIPVPVEETLPEDEAAEELAAEEQMAEAEELADELEPPVREVAPGVTAYEFSRMQDDDAKRQAAASLVSQLSRRPAPEPVAESDEVQRYTIDEDGIEGFLVPRSLLPKRTGQQNQPIDRYEYVYGNTLTGQGFGLYARHIKDRNARNKDAWRDEYGPGRLELEDNERLRKWGEAQRSRRSAPPPAPEPAFPYRSAAEWLNALEAQGVINAQGKVDIAGIAQAARAERERDIEEIIRKAFPPAKAILVQAPAQVGLNGQVLVPARSGYVLEGSTGQTLADTAEEVEQRWGAIFAERAEAERERLRRLSADSFKAERAFALGFDYLLKDYLDETYPDEPLRQAHARDILTKPDARREGKKKTDKIFRGTRAEVADQMLKEGYILSFQRTPESSKEVPLIKNWQGYFQVEPEVFKFAEWLKERRKRDDLASEEEAAAEERRFRTSNPRNRRPNPELGTSMVYGYGINTMTPSAPMGASAAAVRQARLAAEAERLAQRLARGRR